MGKIFALMLSFAFLCASFGKEDDSTKKLCWAHAVGWGFDMKNGWDEFAVNDEIFAFQSNSLLGRDTHTDDGAWKSTARQIECASKRGVNGLMVDCPNPKSYPNTMRRYYAAAKGGDFKLALCMDNLGAPENEILDGLKKFLSEFGNNPNNAYVDGRPVIFIYNTDGKTPAQWTEIVRKLNAEGFNPYFLARALTEIQTSESPERLDALAAAFDGFYDFGVCGFSRDVMSARLKMLKDALARAEKTGHKKLLTASVAQGYTERRTTFYRPYLGTRTMRDNWAAALQNSTDWICLTTWNDYGENTQFEPSDIFGAAPLFLNAAFLKIWRGESGQAKDGGFVISYMEACVDGLDLAIETVNASNSDERLFIKLIPDCGKPETFEIHSGGSAAEAKTLRLADAQISDWRTVRVLAGTCKRGGKDADIVWRELAPIMRHPARAGSYRTLRFVLADSLAENSAAMKLDRAAQVAEVSFSGAPFEGTFELLRNGRPVASQSVSLKAGENFSSKIPLPERMESRADVYAAKFSNASGTFALSAPEKLLNKKFESGKKTRQPFIEIGGTFDECWPSWRNSEVRGAPEVSFREIPESSIFSAAWLLKEKEPRFLSSSKLGWRIPAKLGTERIRSRRDALYAPKWAEAEVFGRKKPVLEFGGNDAISLRVDSMPETVFTVEAVILPEARANAQKPETFFTDWRRFSLFLNPDGILVAEFNGQSVPAVQPISFGAWTHIAVVNAGDAISIYADGRKIGEAGIEVRARFSGSVPIFGSGGRTDGSGFVGKLSAFSIEGAARGAQNFRLKKYGGNSKD